MKKGGKARAATGHLEKPELFDLVSLDFVGPRKFGRIQRWILVLIDHYSRYAVVVPTLTETAQETIQVVRDSWVGFSGASRAVLTDRGSAFVSNEFTKANIHKC
eukprot:GHVN01102184.1.p1 GENE.GHVN01102184.1~~GHVN01102184.1.p1  ORF type:complete len:104 (-),score=1.50 GHVN01102184.1:9-320(-)